MHADIFYFILCLFYFISFCTILFMDLVNMFESVFHQIDTHRGRKATQWGKRKSVLPAYVILIADL